MNSLSKRFKNIEIKSRVLSIGRLPDNDIQILDKRLSGKHCRLLRKFDESGKMMAILEDFSSNGTFVNGTIVSF